LKNLAALLFAAGLAAACGSGSGTSPSTAASPTVASSTSASARQIKVGEVVTGTLTAPGANASFDLTAPSDGTLVARLTWETQAGRLALTVADKYVQFYPDNLSPLVGKLPVAAGQTYRLSVADGAPWDYDRLFLPFTLTTSVE